MIRRIATLALAMLAAAFVATAPAHAAPRDIPPEVAKLYQDKPVIELVTMGIGSLIWERHGHIALCVRYESPQDDTCYNYGIGDFAHPLQMAWGFFRGNGAFWVGKAPPQEMLWIYKHTDRSIWVQPLPLTAEQKQKILAKLEYDVLEEHRHYAYDHFWDNCTTRVRDIIDDATGGKLRAMSGPPDDRTYRDLAREGFLGMQDNARLALLATDLAMGRVTDRVPSFYERMFLPQYLREAVTQLWNIPPIPLYERQGPTPPPEGPSGRVLFALIILGLTAPVWIARLVGRFQRTGLALAVIPYVLLGIVFTGLAIISPLSYVRWNETCLVWLPLDILVLILPATARQKYARGRLVMLALLAVLSVVNVIKAPLWFAMLWPAVPMAVVGLWGLRPASKIGQAGKDAVVPPTAKSARAS